MSRKFKLQNKYYGEEYRMYKRVNIEIQEGLTVLVGCNGIGKTTLLHQIKDQLKKANIPVISFDNLKEGGSRAISSAGFYGDFTFMGTAMSSSEGENIVMNISKLASSLRPFIKTGKSSKSDDALSKAFAKALWGDSTEEKEEETPKERWILLDAIDSGLSVDNIVDIKEYLFKTIFDDKEDLKVYIIVSANEYEMAREEQCFDVHSGKYITFNDYEDYRNFVLKSKNNKNKRYPD